MVGWRGLLFHLAMATLRRRRDLVLENLALRHQLLVLHRTARPPRLSGPDRALWVWLMRRWQAWKTCLRIARPGTVIRWHQAGFRLFWKGKSRRRRGGRRPADREWVSLIRQMSRANALGLDKNAPEPRPVQRADAGEIVAFPQVGGLHHRYERRAA